jgi:hypothetical protein
MADQRGTLRPDAVDVGRTFDFFHVPGAALELRILDTDQGTVSGYFDNREKFVNAVQSLACRGPSTFITLNPGHPDLLARAYNHVKFRAKLTTADIHILRRRFALVDCDAVRIAGISATDSEHDFAIERLHHIVDALRSEGFPEPALGDSGNGGHALFGLDMPNSEYSRDLLQNCLKVLAGRFDDSRVKIDQAVFNAARVGKLFGTPVAKGTDLAERPHRLSRWLRIPENIQLVPIELLEELARAIEPTTRTTTNAASLPARKPPHGKRRFDLDAFIAQHNIETRPPESYEGGRIFRLLACLFNPEHKGKDAAIIERADDTLCYHCVHSSCSKKGWRDVRELYEGRRSKCNGASPPSLSSPPPSSSLPPPSQSHLPASSPQPPSLPVSSMPLPPPPIQPPPNATNCAGPSSLPVIDAGDYQLRDIIVKSLAALQAANNTALASDRDGCALSLFTRGGRIVEIVRADDRTVILDASESIVRRHLSLAADYVRYTNKGDVRGVPPPVDVARGVIDTHPGEEWGLMPVEAVIEVPAFRPDGTVIFREGFDSSTHLYYAPAPGLKNIRIPVSPTSDEIRTAKDLLEETFIDFRFVDGASRTNVIAALLTLFVRTMIHGCVPALAPDATTQGSGKTLVAKILALILTGKLAILHAAPAQPEEWHKTLTAILRYGPALVVFDNVVHPLNSDALSCALTSGVYADRILGFSEKIEMPVRAVVAFTGNNIRAVGDMERRVFWARQDPEIPDPENRSGFLHPELEKWVIINRLSLIEAVLTLIRAWFAAGQPKADFHRGSFDEWAQTIGGILENADIHHFLENRTASYAADADVVEFGAFLLEIKEIFDEPFLTIDLVKVLSDPLVIYDKLREALPDWMREKSKEEGQFCAFLGNVFGKRLDRRNRPSGVYITKEGNTGGKARWKIVVPDPRGQPPSTAATAPQWADDPRDEDVPPPRGGGAAGAPDTTVFLSIKGKGSVPFPSPEAADAFRSAHPEVIDETAG